MILLILLLSCSAGNKFEKSYYDNGNLRYKASKKNNYFNGDAEYWDEEGNLINEVEYLNGMIHGQWVDYYLSGSIKSIANYNFDKKDGLETYYYENGNKKSETFYENNIPVKNTIRWNIKGEILK